MASKRAESSTVDDIRITEEIITSEGNARRTESAGLILKGTLVAHGYEIYIMHWDPIVDI